MFCAMQESEEVGVRKPAEFPLGTQERVVEQLRRAITGGLHAPGDALSEVALAEAYGASRTPVREALKQLQVDGLVEIRPRVGTFVRGLSRREVVELFQIKEVLEGLGARLLAGRGRVVEVDRLEENLSRARRALAEGDLDTCARLTHEFHDLVVLGADNTSLVHRHRRLTDQLAYHRLAAGPSRRPRAFESALDEHRIVLDRVIDKDGFGAEAAMRHHARAGEQAVMAADPWGEDLREA
jgi:DNA-binding GntR family transcriptional regulator